MADNIQQELRDINERLGFMSGTLKGIEARLDREDREDVKKRVEGLEIREGRNLGYVAGISGAGVIIAAILGFIL